MKKTMKKLLCIALLAMVSIGANAQESLVNVGFSKFTGGTVSVKSQTASATETDYVDVVITVTPADGYYIAKGDIIVAPTMAPVRRTSENEEGLKIGDPLELKGEDPTDLTEERDYTFTVYKELGAMVYEAGFHQIATSGAIGEKDAVAWEVKTETVTVGEGEEARQVEVKTLTFTGDTGIPAMEEGASAPWEMLKGKITNVVIGEGITAISENLFEGFTSLSSIQILNDKSVISLGKDAVPANTGLTIDVPGNLYNEYTIADGWKDLSIDSKNAVKMEGVEFGTSNSYDTFCFSKAVKVPSVLRAIIITGIKDNILLTQEVENIIPANMPVLLLSKELKGNDFRTSEAPEQGSDTKGATTPTNLLKVAPEGGKTVTLGEVYLIYNDVFYLSQAGTIAAGGVYLDTSVEQNGEPAKARSFALAIGNAASGTTGISTVSNADPTPVWHTLDGRILNGKPTKKGLYIKDGEKILVK